MRLNFSLKKVTKSGKEKTSIHSCVISAYNLSKRAFTYVKDGKWLSRLWDAYSVNNLNMNMRKPLEISNDESNPTVITMIIPLTSSLRHPKRQSGHIAV